VEDEEMVRSFTRKALIKNGYKVFTAANVDEAKRIFTSKNGHFELLFSDVVLPDGNGIELVDQILSENPQIKILLASGYTDKKSQWPLIKKRGFEFLQKPYDLGGLLRTLREVLETETSNEKDAEETDASLL
jgi:DNA-binding NtrC family response regulator